MEFYSSSNNGVIALISKEDAMKYVTGVDPTLFGVRVFTFCQKERIQNDPIQKMVMTGSFDDMDALLKLGGHRILSARPINCRWDGFVPFSNGCEYGMHGEERKEKELRFMTTLSDLLQVFGTAPFQASH